MATKAVTARRRRQLLLSGDPPLPLLQGILTLADSSSVFHKDAQLGCQRAERQRRSRKLAQLVQ